MPENLLSIDVGTQSVRALVFDPKGNLLVRQRVPIEPYFSKAPGLAEQYPHVYVNAMCDAIHGLWEQNTVRLDEIVAVTLTTQRSTVINVDKDGKPLRPAIVWLDQRRTEGLKPIGGLWGLAFLAAGATETVAYLQAEAEANWISKYQPDIWEKTHKYMLLSAYLNYQLTGRFADSVGSTVAYLPFDYKRQTWSRPYDWKWQAIPVQKEKLVDLVSQGKVLGEVTRWAAERFGLREGLPVIAAAADKACEVLGAGCLTPDTACLSYGTTATINTTHEKYIEVIPLIPPYPAASPGKYNFEIQIYRGYWMVSWFKHEFGLREEQAAAELGVQPEELFDDLVREVPPGSDGLVLQPYWSPGLRHPGPEARGAIIGFGDNHTRAHIYRAILEGLAYALREGKERTEKRAKVKIERLRIAGGGSQSDAAMQLTADVFGLPVSRPHVYEASGLGAAIVAAVGAGIHPGFDEAVRSMTRVRDTFEPLPEAQAVYDELYNSVYLRMYSRLQPFYREIRRITARENQAQDER